MNSISFPILTAALGAALMIVALLLMTIVRPYLMRRRVAHAHGMNVLALGIGCKGLARFSPEATLERFVLSISGDTLIVIGVIGILISMWSTIMTRRSHANDLRP